MPPLGALVNAPNLARHGVILPFSWFGGIALLHFWGSLLSERQPAASACGGQANGGSDGPRDHSLGKRLRAETGLRCDHCWILPAETVTHDDVAALTWLRDNTPNDVLLMAADGEGWLPIFAERRAVDLRAVAYFEWDAVETVDDEKEVDFVFQSSRWRGAAGLATATGFRAGALRGYMRWLGDNLLGVVSSLVRSRFDDLGSPLAGFARFGADKGNMLQMTPLELLSRLCQSCHVLDEPCKTLQRQRAGRRRMVKAVHALRWRSFSL